MNHPETSALLFALSLGFSVSMLVGAVVDRMSFKKFSAETQLSQESVPTISALIIILISFGGIWFFQPIWGGIMAAIVGSLSIIMQAVLEPAESGLWSHPRKKTALLISLPIVAIPLAAFIPDPSYIPIVYVSLISHRHKQNLRYSLRTNLEAIEMLRFKVLAGKAALEMTKSQNPHQISNLSTETVSKTDDRFPTAV